MADASVAAGKTGVTVTLTAATVSTVTFADSLSNVTVISDGTAVVVYTVDGSTPTNPAVGTARTGYYIPASAAVATQTGGSVVKLLSAGTPTITVERA